MRYSKKELKEIESRLNNLIGYDRFRFGHRYNYYAIDEYNENGACLRTYRSGLRMSEVVETYQDILKGMSILAEIKGIKL